MLATGAAAWVLCTTRGGDPRHGHLGKCASNLRQIHVLALLYAGERGSFPTAAGLGDFMAFVGKQDVSPELFQCPAAADSTSTNYAWAARPLRPDGPPRPLVSDRFTDGFVDAVGEHHGHRGGVNVVYTDGSVRWMRESELSPDTKLPPGLVK